MSVRVAHVATVDLTPRFLLLPQLFGRILEPFISTWIRLVT